MSSLFKRLQPQSLLPRATGKVTESVVGPLGANKPTGSMPGQSNNQMGSGKQGGGKQGGGKQGGSPSSSGSAYTPTPAPEPKKWANPASTAPYDPNPEE